MFESPAVPEDIRAGQPLTHREQKILRAFESELSTPRRLRRTAGSGHESSFRLDAPMILIAGLFTQLLAALALSVTVLVVDVTLCLGGLLAATL